MYAPWQVALASVLGGPLGGAWLMALNYKRLGKPRLAWVTIAITVVGLAAVFGIMAAISSQTPSVAIPLIIAMYWLAKALQGTAYDRHAAVGGRLGSTWRAVGLGVASLAISGAAVVGAGVGYELATAPDDVAIGEIQVRYAEGATREEARAVGNLLITRTFIHPDRPATLLVTRARGRRVVEIVVNDFVFSDDDSQLTVHELAEPLSREVYGGVQVDIWLTDESLEPRVKLPWETRPREVDLGDQHIVIFRQGAAEAEARAVGTVLEDTGYFAPGKHGTAVVRRVSSRAIVELRFQTAAFDDTAALSAGLRGIAGRQSDEAFGGKPVDLWLDDTKHVTRVKLSWEDRPQ
jgi:hypothetical protein